MISVTIIDCSKFSILLFLHCIFKDSSRNIEQIIKDEVDLDKDGLVSKKEIIHRMEKSFSQQRQNEVDGLMNKHDISKKLKSCYFFR